MNLQILWSKRLKLAVTGVFVLSAAALLSGCSQEEVRVYNIPKETIADEPGHAHWELPSGWKELPAQGMRVASFTVPGPDAQSAEVTVIPLAGSTASELENVNRWRQQVGLEPITADQLPSVSQKVSVGDKQGSLVELAGSNPATKKPERILAATLAAGNTTWFIKMTGPDALVAGEKAAFVKFLNSLTFHDADAHRAPPRASTQAQRERGSPAAASTSPAASDALPHWTVPAGWEAQPQTPMVLARFTAGDQNAKAEITVTAFPGEVGGLLANVNRWRGQIQLPPIDQSELTNHLSDLDVNGQKAVLIDMTNPSATSSNQANRVIVAVVRHDQRTWFFKMTGDKAMLEQQKSAFVNFVQSVRFPHA